MEKETLIVALFLSVLVLVVQPRHALVVYLIGLLWYPSYLAVSIGTIDILVGRFVVAVLLLRCIFNNQIRTNFRWSRLDTWIACNMVVYVGVHLIIHPTLLAMENRAGYVMDTWFAYLVARFIITDRAKLISVIKCISIVLLPLAILGCIETLTGWQPFVPLRQFTPWATKTGTDEIEREIRWGLTRAVGPFSHPILFGSGFAMFLPLIYYLRHEKDNWRKLAYIFSAVAIIGALSSMSSGPWVMTIVIIFCLFMERYHQWVKPLLKFFILSCVMIEILSNRTFYHVIFTYAGLLGGAGWHRARIIDAAISHFGEWWLAGYGGKDPGWGSYVGMGRTDVTNEYILSGVYYGISGIIVLCGVLITAFRGVIASYKNYAHPVMKSLFWAFGCILTAVAVVWMSVDFFGQILSLYYCMLGIIGSMIYLGKKHQTKDIRRIYRNQVHGV